MPATAPWERRHASPSICCVPVSWPSGLGEVARSLALAAAAREAWPQARLHLLLNRDLPPRVRGLIPAWCEVGWLPTSATWDDAGVRAALRRCAPDVVVFDNAGTWRQCRSAKRGGARTVYLSARRQTRVRGLHPRWLPWLDEHWTVGPRIFEAPLTRWQRLKAAASGTAVRSWQTLFLPSQPAARAAHRRAAGCADRPYVCFVPGGGGGIVEGHSAVALFADAAALVAQRTGLACVLVEGPLHRDAPPLRPGVTVQPATHAQTIDLMTDAELVVVGAGSSLTHALAQQRLCVTTTTGGADQPARARACAAHGLAVASPPHAAALAAGACDLLADAPRAARMRQRIAAAGLTNDLPQAVAALGQLLAAPGCGQS